MKSPAESPEDPHSEKGNEERTAKFELDGKEFELEHSAGKGFPPGAWAFVQENWYEPKEVFESFPQGGSGFFAGALRRGLERMENYTARDESGEIVAICLYKPFLSEEESLDDAANLYLIVVREDERGHGMGAYLSRKAVDDLIRAAKTGGPAEVRGDATTEDGLKMLEAIKRMYGDRIKLMVKNEYKYSDEALPKGFEIFSFSMEIEDSKGQLKTLTDAYVEKDFSYLGQTEKDNLKGALIDRVIELHDALRMRFVADANRTIIGISGYESRGENTEGTPKMELTPIFLQSADQAKEILQILIANSLKAIFKENNESIVGLMTKDPDLIAVVKELGFVEVSPEEYLREIRNGENMDHLEAIKKDQLRALVLRGCFKIARQEI